MKISNELIFCWQYRSFQSAHSIAKNSTYSPSAWDFPITFTTMPRVFLTGYNDPIILTQEEVTITSCQIALYNAHTSTFGATGYALFAVGY